MSTFAPHAIDFYKTGHGSQYAPNTTHISSTWTARFNKHAVAYAIDGKTPDEIVVIGTHAVCQKILKRQFDKFFKMPYQKAVRKFKNRVDAALGKGAVSTQQIAMLHQLQYLPIEVYSLPEGTRCPMKVASALIRSTHVDFAWVTNYIETVFSNESWKMPTIATIAFQYRLLLEKFAELTGASKDFVKWQGHDFSARGMSGQEDASWSSMGHLTSFYGTDTVGALDSIDKYYATVTPIIAGSVPATEHSVMSLNIIKRMNEILAENPEMSRIDAKHQAEIDVVRRLITEVVPTGVISIVGDTFDWFRFINEIIPALKSEILARQKNELGLAKVVSRPDSGNPIHIVAGYRVQDLGTTDLTPERAMTDALHAGIVNERTELLRINGVCYRCTDISDENSFSTDYEFVVVSDVEAEGAVATLWRHFGGTETSKGYKELNQAVGLIYGDSITIPIATEILTRLAENGFASSNIVFGIGSFTYQYITRDTFGYAIKAVYGVSDGMKINIVKDPLTDSSKRSAEGLVRVELIDGKYVMFDKQDPDNYDPGELELVFRNSQMMSSVPFNVICARVDAAIALELAK